MSSRGLHLGTRCRNVRVSQPSARRGGTCRQQEHPAGTRPARCRSGGSDQLERPRGARPGWVPVVLRPQHVGPRLAESVGALGSASTISSTAMRAPGRRCPARSVTAVPHAVSVSELSRCPLVARSFGHPDARSRRRIAQPTRPAGNYALIVSCRAVGRELYRPESVAEPAGAPVHRTTTDVRIPLGTVLSGVRDLRRPAAALGSTVENLSIPTYPVRDSYQISELRPCSAEQHRVGRLLGSRSVSGRNARLRVVRDFLSAFLATAEAPAGAHLSCLGRRVGGTAGPEGSGQNPERIEDGPP